MAIKYNPLKENNNNNNLQTLKSWNYSAFDSKSMFMQSLSEGFDIISDEIL